MASARAPHGSWPTVATLLAVALLLLGAVSCAPNSGARPSGPDTRQTQLQAVLVTTQFIPGRQRVAIGVLQQNTPVNDARVHVRAFRGAPSDPLASDADAPFKGEGLDGRGVYVAYLTLASASVCVFEISATTDRGQASTTRVAANVQATGTTPVPGQKAPLSHNPTRRDVADLGEIDSGIPPNDMHELSIAEAIAQQRPALVVFATPAFCTSAMCGPEVHAVQRLEPTYRDRIAFVHVEIYQNYKPDPGKKALTPTVIEWRLQSEPWVFLIDRSGTIAYAFEGPTATDELRVALDAMLAAP